MLEMTKDDAVNLGWEVALAAMLNRFEPTSIDLCLLVRSNLEATRSLRTDLL